jgi:hypothetical protein
MDCLLNIGEFDNSKHSAVVFSLLILHKIGMSNHNSRFWVVYSSHLSHADAWISMMETFPSLYGLEALFILGHQICLAEYKKSESFWTVL